MRISHVSYKEYVTKISSHLIGKKLFTPILLNEETLVFPLMEEQKQSFVISLNSKMPLAYLAKDDVFFSSFENKFVQKFRKEIGKFFIDEISLDKKDLILSIKIRTFELVEKSYKLIAELIPNKPNLLLLGCDEKIIDHYYHSSSRDLAKGALYAQPANSFEQIAGLSIDEKLIEDHYKKQFEIRREEKFRLFKKFITSKIKACERKIDNINRDGINAKVTLECEDNANYILSYFSNELKSHKSSVDIEGKLIELDESKTLLENSQKFFKQAKRAKEAISRSQINLENAQKERSEYQEILNKFNISNEKEADNLVALYGQVKKKKEVKETIFNKPWKLNLNGTIIYFGRNASQNDYLSFVMKLDREFTWLHIKDKSGAHLVIANKNPTEAELLYACEISLLCSRATSGEIVCTKKKNVRRGHVLGEAILKNHSTIKLNSIRKETIESFALAKRCD